MGRLIALVVLALPLIANGQEPRPNTPTAREAADNWVLLFDGETTSGWTVEGEAKVENGVLVLGGKTRGASATTTNLFGAGTLEMQTKEEGKEGTVTFHDKTLAVGLGNPRGDTWARWSWSRRGTKFAVTHLREPQGTNIEGQRGEIRVSPLRIVVPAGGTVKLREIRFRPDAPPPSE